MRAIIYMLCSLLLWLPTYVMAQPDMSSYGSPFSSSTARLPSNPVDTLNEGMGRLIGFLREKNTSKEAIQQFLQNDTVRYFDFKRMAVLVAGPWLQKMALEQRNLLKEQLMQDFLITLAERLSAYSDQSAQVLSIRSLQGNEAVVSVAVNSPNGVPIRLDFRMFLDQDGWKIYDIAANGSSAALYYRTRLQTRIRTLSSTQRFHLLP